MAESAGGSPLSGHLPATTVVSTTSLSTIRPENLFTELGPIVSSLNERIRDAWSTVCGFFRDFFDSVQSGRSTPALNLYSVENARLSTEERLLVSPPVYLILYAPAPFPYLFRHVGCFFFYHPV
ncbi:unnamed protein product [Schistocephalus solidus]|uniref:Uncharacterized protein n=1 Tax=Schistocephalus solidus TaxID=70667 RepID=A0A183SAE3_SCHSO|nr:unnamed protein product [Schistocephalus solidus]